MALITCPNCQKKISDTSGKCVHCGFDFAKAQISNYAEEKNFHKLSSAEQENLRKEFYTAYPKYGAYNKKQDRFYKSINVTRIISFAALAIFIILVVAFRIYHSVTKTDVPIILIIPLFMMLGIWLISGLVCWFLILVPSRKYKKNEMIVEKKFQKWLSDYKNISYTVSFTKKMKKYKQFFDSVNVDRQDIE